jgi:hypothetical protein
MGKTKQPVPVFASRRPAEACGVLRDNVELAAGMPEVSAALCLPAGAWVGRRRAEGGRHQRPGRLQACRWWGLF